MAGESRSGTILDEALERVKSLASQGTDPRSEQQTERKQLTFKALAGRYVEEYAKRHKRTWAEDERILGKYFRKWHKRRADEITALDAYNLLKTSQRRAWTTASPRRSWRIALAHVYPNCSTGRRDIRTSQYRPIR